MSFLELIAFPSSSPPNIGDRTRQHDAFLETVRHVGIRLSGTTDMIAEALMQAHSGADRIVERQELERMQPVLRTLFRRNLAAEVMVGLYLEAAAKDCDARKAAAKSRRTTHFVDPRHDVTKTIQQGRD